MYRKNQTFIQLNLTIVIILFTILYSCDNKNEEVFNGTFGNGFLAKVTTTSPSNITATTVTTGGVIENTGNCYILSCGVCWSTNINPTIELSTKTSDERGKGSFVSKIEGLVGGTTYHIRAYATNSEGTSYGDDLTFNTSTTLPTVITSEASNISANSANLGGTIVHNGGEAITVCGICWSTTSNPTTSLATKTINGSLNGLFTNLISSLNASTTYYVRAYATNIIGTSYGNQISFTTLPIDNDGNIYNTITIGNQIWMKENLKTTTYNDGTPIEFVTDNIEWQNKTSGAYTWYNNDESTYKNTYGGLYNWYAVNTMKLCPINWHVPTEAEFKTLYMNLGDYGTYGLGGKLKEIGTLHWNSPNTGATNSTGFTALPGGYRYQAGTFHHIGNMGYWWLATENVPSSAYYFAFFYDSADGTSFHNGKTWGYSVRCIKD